jgi:hypothetical protein
MKKSGFTISRNFWLKASMTLAGVLAALILGECWNWQTEAGAGGGSIARAQGLSNNSGSGQQMFCARDYANFLMNGLDFDGEGFLDYWRDILVIYNANYCQYTDIDSLLNRIDQARKQIRQAFYVCDTVTSGKIAADYYQMSAELYYLRHFVSTKESPNPKASDAEKDQLVQPDPSVHEKFINMFVNKLKYFDAATAETTFTKIQQKYNAKMQEYKNCSDPNFAALKQKVLELIGTVDTIKKLALHFQEQVQQRWGAMEKRVAGSKGLWSAFSADSIGDFFSRVTDLRVNSEPISETTVWEQLSNTVKQNTPGMTGTNTGQVAKPLPPVITYDSVVQDMANIKKRDSDADSDIKYVTEYDMKYRQVSGAALDNMKITLQALQQSIDDTFDPLNDIRICVSDVIGKQCGG